MESIRFAQGSDLLSRIDGEGGTSVIESLADIAPDVGRYIVEFAFGDIYARPRRAQRWLDQKRSYRGVHPVHSLYRISPSAQRHKRRPGSVRRE